MTDNENDEDVGPHNVFADASLPHIYTNGFRITLGNSDVAFTFQMNGVPVQTLNMPHSVAKALSQKVAETLDFLEVHSGIEIHDLDNIASTIQDYVKSKAQQEET